MCVSRYRTVQMHKQHENTLDLWSRKKAKQSIETISQRRGMSTEPGNLVYMLQSFSKFTLGRRKKQISLKEAKNIMVPAVKDNISRGVRWYLSGRQTYRFSTITYQHNSKYGQIPEQWQMPTVPDCYTIRFNLRWISIQ